MSNRTILVECNVYDGPHEIRITSFNEVAGVYLIANGNGNIIDVGETENLKIRIANHERVRCWLRNGGFYLWFHHENNLLKRQAIEKNIRDKFNPVCGVR